MMEGAGLAVLALTSVGALSGCSTPMGSTAASAQMAGPMNGGPMTMASVEQMVSGWPEKSRMAAMDMMRSYGPPQEVTPSMLMWMNNGPWKWTKVSRETIPHNFPMPHPDLLEQAIDYQVPLGRYDDLARYDGSVIAERTKGQLSARCDKEGANFLAINLANEVATGRRTPEDARRMYGEQIKMMKAGQMTPYTSGLMFTPPPSGNDSDRPIM